MILYIENPKDSTKKLLELIKKFSRTIGYKINIQKSVEYLYTNNELSERETKKTILFTIALKKKTIKKLTKEVRKVDLKYYKILKKEIEEYTNKWKHMPCSGVEILNIIKSP